MPLLRRTLEASKATVCKQSAVNSVMSEQGHSDVSAIAKSNDQHGPARFLLVFVFVQVLLFTVTLLEPVRIAAIVPLTETLAAISAFLMTSIDSSVIAQGVLISNSRTGFGIEIVAGCNGVEPAIMLIAAMVAFPAAVRDKLVGIAIGILAIQALNVTRIITLYYIGQWSLAAYEWAHLYLWPAMILVDALLVWLLWVRHLQRRRAVTVRAVAA